MKLTIILFIITLVAIPNLIRGQNLFFIGNKSYPCTETMILKSDSKYDVDDLSIVIAKDGEKGKLVLSVETLTETEIRGTAIVYLDNGSVISCKDRNIYDFVNGISTTVYSLTVEEVSKMTQSNINTIRFNLKCGSRCEFSSEEGSYSASNKPEKKPLITFDSSKPSYEIIREETAKNIQNLFGL